MLDLDLDLALRFAAAIGLGLLLGLERERSGTHDLLFGGVRAFALIALLGAVGAFAHGELGIGGLAPASFVCVAAFVLVSYAITARWSRPRRRWPGPRRLDRRVRGTLRAPAEHTMSIWRRDPEVSPGAVGVDAALLDRMVEEFESTLEKGRLFHGAQMAVYRAGKRVLDVGGGLARVRTQQPVRPESLFVLFSASKGLAGLAMLMLYERRKFHYDEPVSKYWPEFTRVVPGKAAVTIRHVMSHRAGFPLGPRWLDAELWGDRAEIRRAMEEVRLRFTPGERNAYHAMNYGHMVNELIRRIDGRDCGAFLREEVFGPLGLRDLHLGLPDDAALEARVAWCYNEIDLSPGRAAARATGVVSGELEQARAEGEAEERLDPTPQRREPPARYADIPEMWHEFNWPETHRAVLPAAGGIGTACELGALYAFLAQGGARGELALVSREGLAYATTPTNREGEIDGTIGFPLRWGLGFHMGMHGRGSTLRSFGHAGAGGQIGFADPDRELAFAFTTNGELSPEFPLWRYRLQSRAFEACRS